MPRLPLAGDADFAARSIAFFDWIDADARSSVEVDNRLKGRPELRPLVEDDAQGYSYLNAAGDLLLKSTMVDVGILPPADGAFRRLADWNRLDHKRSLRGTPNPRKLSLQPQS